MERITVHMDNGDSLEFNGTLVATTTREVALDGRRSTVFEYRLYKTDQDTFVLALETYEKIRSRNFFLRFNTLKDARDYLARDKQTAPLATHLAPTDPDN